MSVQKLEELEERYRDRVTYATPALVLGQAVADLLRYGVGGLERQELAAMELFAAKYGIAFDTDLVLSTLKEFDRQWEHWDSSACV